MKKIEERRKANHSAVHRLSQVFADLTLAEKEVGKLNLPEYVGQHERDVYYDIRHKAIAFIKESIHVIEHVIDTDLGPRLIEGKDNGKG